MLRLLELASDEGRLNSVEQARRADAVQAAKTRGALAALAADLPDRRGVMDWIDHVRVRGEDRDGRPVG